jgi:anti-sigma B factor antagonist
VEIEVGNSGNVHIIRAKGSLKLGDPVDQLRSALDNVLALPSFCVVLNMAGVPMADSSGLGLLVRYQSTFKQKGGTLKLVAPTKLVTQSLKILGLLSMFELFDDETAAVQSYSAGAAAAAGD